MEKLAQGSEHYHLEKLNVTKYRNHIETSFFLGGFRVEFTHLFFFSALIMSSANSE